MDRGAWWATVHGVSKSWIQLSMHAPKTSISQVKTALSCLNYFLSNTLKLWHAFLSYRCYQGCNSRIIHLPLLQAETSYFYLSFKRNLQREK